MRSGQIIEESFNKSGTMKIRIWIFDIWKILDINKSKPCLSCTFTIKVGLFKHFKAEPWQRTTSTTLLMYSNVTFSLLFLSQPWRPSGYTEPCKHICTQNIHVNLGSMNINDWKSIWVSNQLQYSSVSSVDVNNTVEIRLMC